MLLTGDYHTHTKYSHGKGTILDNAVAAKNKGVKTVAITDHGFSHPAFGMSRRKVAQMQKDCNQAQVQTGVQVLLGMESNVLNIAGKTDYKPTDYDNFDIFLAGFHRFVMASPKAYMQLLLPNEIYRKLKIKVPKYVVKDTTKAYINVIKNNPVDIITHLNFCVAADVVEVAKCCADYGTYLELNSKKIHLTDEELFKVSQTGVRFVIDSDAHSSDRVGDTLRVEEQLSRVDFPMQLIDNIEDRTPNFRFNRFKNKGEL